MIYKKMPLKGTSEHVTLATSICCWASICCCWRVAISCSSERVSSTRGFPTYTRRERRERERERERERKRERERGERERKRERGEREGERREREREERERLAASRSPIASRRAPTRALAPRCSSLFELAPLARVSALSLRDCSPLSRSLALRAILSLRALRGCGWRAPPPPARDDRRERERESVSEGKKEGWSGQKQNICKQTRIQRWPFNSTAINDRRLWETDKCVSAGLIVVRAGCEMTCGQVNTRSLIIAGVLMLVSTC